MTSQMKRLKELGYKHEGLDVHMFECLDHCSGRQETWRSLYLVGEDCAVGHRAIEGSNTSANSFASASDFTMIDSGFVETVI